MNIRSSDKRPKYEACIMLRYVQVEMTNRLAPTVRGPVTFARKAREVIRTHGPNDCI